MMTRRLLVTGGGGFVAGHVLARAASTWPGEILTTRFGSTRATDNGSLPARTLDVRDRIAVLETVRAFAPTDILHLAAISAPAQAQTHPEEAWAANVMGVQYIAEAAALSGARQLVFASSAEVYGRAYLTSPVASEDVTPQPTNIYGKSKLAAEQAMLDILAQSNCSGVIVRAANHSGPGQDERFVTPAFAAQVARIEVGKAAPIVETGDLSSERDFLHVQDVARAYIDILLSDPPAARILVNLGSGRARPVASIIDVLKTLSRAPFEVVANPDRIRRQEIQSAAVDNGRINRLYGWRPKIEFETMVRDVLDDFRARVD